MEKKSLEVSIVVIRKGNNYLLSKRKQSQDFAGLWEFIGGKIENETPISAATRETYEEIGVEITPVFLEKITHEYEKIIINFNVFISDISSNPIACEGQEIKWFTLDKLVKLDMPAANKKFVNLILKLRN